MEKLGQKRKLITAKQVRRAELEANAAPIDPRPYLAGPHNVHQLFVESISVLFQKAFALVFHLFTEKHS